MVERLGIVPRMLVSLLSRSEKLKYGRNYMYKSQ